jgi:hypothetical protein
MGISWQSNWQPPAGLSTDNLKRTKNVKKRTLPRSPGLGVGPRTSAKGIPRPSFSISYGHWQVLLLVVVASRVNTGGYSGWYLPIEPDTQAGNFLESASHGASHAASVVHSVLVHTGKSIRVNFQESTAENLLLLSLSVHTTGASG